MSASSVGWTVATLFIGIGFLGCGAQAAQEDFDATSEAIVESVSANKVTFPAYIVYLQPAPLTNPLYKDVNDFIRKWDSGANLAAAYPPHVSLTGFFDSPFSETAAQTAFTQAFTNIPRPYGQPMVQPKSADNPTTSPVYCQFGTLTITLHVKMQSAYQQFRADVAKRLQATTPAKTASHITLFEASDPALPMSTFQTICADAKTFFNDERVASYNRTSDGHPDWIVTLFHPQTKPTRTNPIDQFTDVITKRANP